MQMGGPMLSALTTEPWRSVPPRTMLYVRHRLARHTNRDIARHYKISEATVRWSLITLARRFRRHGLRVHGVTDVLILAAQDRLPAEPLPADPTFVGVVEPDPPPLAEAG